MARLKQMKHEGRELKNEVGGSKKMKVEITLKETKIESKRSELV